MTARSKVIEKDQPGMYHVYSRVFRGSFLLEDPEIKELVMERLEHLLSFFMIQCCAEAVLDNHWHLVLVIRPDLVDELSDEEVLERARAVFPSYFEKRGLGPNEPLPKRWLRRHGVIREMRRRLSDISWFVHRLNGFLGPQINELLETEGPVFERFKCQRLLNEFGLVACCIYVDLNLVRACMAPTPEESKYTSVWYRIQGAEARRIDDLETARKRDQWLAPIHAYGDHSCYGAEGKRAVEEGCFDFRLVDYLSMLDARGREEAPGKRGKIAEHLPEILERLGATAEQLFEAAEKFSQFRSAFGHEEAMLQEARRRNQRWVQGLSLIREIFRDK